MENNVLGAQERKQSFSKAREGPDTQPNRDVGKLRE